MREKIQGDIESTTGHQEWGPSSRAHCATPRMFVAQHRLQVPKLHVTLRKAFGVGSSVMAISPFAGQTLSLVFPAVTLGSLPVAGCAAVVKIAAAGVHFS